MTSQQAGEVGETARFFDQAILEIAGLNTPNTVRVLDFGCGAGGLVAALSSLGYDVRGCDVIFYDDAPATEIKRQILQSPYRFPYKDNQFDVVISTSVMEHARNPDEYMAEINRVLKPGGYAMHLLPGKWYLPSEPHIFVPLANFFWPKCPTWWFVIWALLGRRNAFQREQDWRTVVATNRAYYDSGLIYLTTAQYDELSRRHFAETRWPMEFYIANGYGTLSRVARHLPFRTFWGWVSREFRMAFLVQRKAQV